jgi:hypothetical protein
MFVNVSDPFSLLSVLDQSKLESFSKTNIQASLIFASKDKNLSTNLLWQHCSLQKLYKSVEA